MKITVPVIVIFHMIMFSQSQFAAPPGFQYPMQLMSGTMPMAFQGQSPYQQSRVPTVMFSYQSQPKPADRQTDRHKRHKHRHYSSEEEESASSEHRRYQKKKRQVLTPIISYVTGSDRVVYRRKINKENIDSWLTAQHEKQSSEESTEETTEVESKHKHSVKKRHEH